MELKTMLQKWLPNKHLILIKILLFTYFGATHSVVPYLAIHMKQIGISVHETAIIHAILPVAMFIGPPISGYIGDKFGCYKLLLFVALIMTGALHTALLWVPQARSEAAPANAVVLCSSAGPKTHVNVTFSVTTEDCSDTTRTSVIFKDCLNQCPNPYAYFTVHPESEDGDIAFCGSSSPRQWEGHSTCITFSNATKSYSIITNSLNESEQVFNAKFEGLPQDGTSMSCPMVSQNNCTLFCPQTVSISDLRSSKCGDPKLTFWLYLVIRILASIFMSCCYVLLDSVTMHIIEQNDTDYGKQRLWSVLATAVFPPIAGFLVDYTSPSDDVPNYSPTFYVQDVLLVITALVSTLMTVKISLSSETNLKTVCQLVKTPRADWLFVALFVLGTMWGFVEVFLYWYLLDLNSPKYLLGLTLTVGSGIGVPVLFFAETIIEKVGHVNVVFTAFIFYCIRYVGYSFIYNPWWCLIFEAMEIFTLHVMWVAVVKYGRLLAPKALIATMLGAIGGTHYGVGRGSGSLIGGLLMGRFGARDTFRYMGIAAATAGIMYISVEKIFFKAPLTKKDEKSEEVEGDKGKDTRKNLELEARSVSSPSEDVENSKSHKN